MGNHTERLPKRENNVRLPFESLNMLMGHIKDGTFREVFEDWKWILGYSAKYKRAVLYYVLIGILSTTMSLVSGVAGKYMIDIITGYDVSRLWLMVSIMAVSALLGVLFQSVTSRICARLSIHIHNDIQADIFDKILDADWLALKQYSNGDIINRINTDMGVVSSNAVSWLPTVIIAIYHFVATFLVLCYYDWVMAVIALASAPVLILFSRLIMKKQRAYSKNVREKGSKMMSFEVETFYGVDTIKSFGLTGYYGGKLRAFQEEYRNASLAYNMFTISTNAMMSVVSTVVQFAAFGYCLFRLWTHSISFGTMTLFLQQRSSLSSAFNHIVSIVPSFLNSAVSAHRIRELVELPKEVHLHQEVLGQKELKSGLSVCMDQVEFFYEQDKEVLEKADFEAGPGEIVALVGPSGEGKTTMLRLMLGLVRPEKGSAYLTCADGRKIWINADTRYVFSYVPQGNTVFSGTIADNLRMVKEDATEEEMIQVLKIACAWDFVEAKKGGIHRNIGERGQGLSEGQAQRLAIARALLRDAPVLLLDEATSALDIMTERRVLKNIMTEQPHKTCIVTTHRPSVLNMCHRVYRVSQSTLKPLTKEESEQLVMEF